MASLSPQMKLVAGYNEWNESSVGFHSDRQKNACRSTPRIVCFTTVHYYDTPNLHKLIANIGQLQLPSGWRIVVAVSDNSDSWTDAPEVGCEVRVFQPRKNLGYLPGCAFALRQWTAQKKTRPEWVAVVNSDITIKPDVVQRLLELRWPDDVAAIAPDIRGPGNVPQNPFLISRPSSLRMRLYTFVFRSLWLTRLLGLLGKMKRRWRKGNGDLKRVGHMPIYAPFGCALFLHRRFFERGGTLDYRSFMFGEEIHIAEQLRRLNLRVIFVPSLQIHHDTHGTIGVVKRRTRMRWQRESSRVLWEDYFSNGNDGTVF